MSSLFLFFDTFNQDCYHGVIINNQQIVSTIQSYQLSEIHALQKKNIIIIILTCKNFSLHSVQLPDLPLQKLTTAIPYTLEESLLHNIDDLNFAFDKNYMVNNNYLVTVCTKTYITQVIAQLSQQLIKFHEITLDWFALQTNESWYLQDYALISAPNFYGSLPLSIASQYFPNPNITIDDNDIYNAIAQKISQNSYINLYSNKNIKNHKILYYSTGILVLLWLSTILFFKIYNNHLQIEEITALDIQLHKIYHNFFPNSQEVSNPEISITKLLHEQKQSNLLWLKLHQFIIAINIKNITLQKITWHNNILQLTIITQDFKTLNTIQKKLQQKQVKYKQTHMSMRNNKITSILELI